MTVRVADAIRLAFVGFCLGNLFQILMRDGFAAHVPAWVPWCVR